MDTWMQNEGDVVWPDRATGINSNQWPATNKLIVDYSANLSRQSINSDLSQVGWLVGWGD